MSYECQGDYQRRMKLQASNKDKLEAITQSLEDIKKMMNDIKIIKQDIIVIKELVKKKEERDMNKWGILWT